MACCNILCFILIFYQHQTVTDLVKKGCANLLQVCSLGFITLDLPQQQEDPAFPLMHDTMVELLCSSRQHPEPEIVVFFHMQSASAFAQHVSHSEVQSSEAEIFLGFAVCLKLWVQMYDGKISQTEHHAFSPATWAFQSNLNYYANKLQMLETAFALHHHQSIQVKEIPSQAWAEATIRVASEDRAQLSIHCWNVLWHYIQQEFLVGGMAFSKFHNLVRLAKLTLILLHSNDKEESVFFWTGKNKTKFCANLSLEYSAFHYHVPDESTSICFNYKPSQDVCTAAKDVTQQYNKAHCSSAVTTAADT